MEAEMIKWLMIGSVCGLFIGANIALVVMALCIMASKRGEFKINTEMKP